MRTSTSTAVREILAGAGLTEADLQNTPDYPYDESARDGWIASGSPKQSIAQNCSGKHAAMLATCVVNGWDLTTYRDPSHPLQVAIADTVADLTGDRVERRRRRRLRRPVHAVSLAGLARAFGRIAAATDGTARPEVADAIRDFPEYLGGTRRDVTALIRGTDGPRRQGRRRGRVRRGPGRRPRRRRQGRRRRPAGPPCPARRRAAPHRRRQSTTSCGSLEHAPVLGHGQPVGSVVAVGRLRRSP